MSRLKTIVAAVSLAFNAALLAVLAGGGSSNAIAPKTTQGTAKGSVPTGNPNLDPKVWASLTDANLSNMIQRLRDAGFPPHMIRAIIRAQVADLFAERRKAILESNVNKPYWMSRPIDLQGQVALRTLQKEQQKMMDSLLGKVGPDLMNLNGLLAHRSLDGIPAEKRDSVQQMRDNFAQRRSDLVAQLQSNPSPEDGAKLQALAKEEQDSLKGILTPAELNEYELYSSNTSQSLRFRLSAFDPTEQEFRALFSISRATEASRVATTGALLNQEQADQRAEAFRQATQQIAEALGPERYAEYQKTTNPNYRTTSQLVARLDLPPESTDQLWNLSSDIRQRQLAINGDPTLAPDARRDQLAVLNQEAQTKATAVLGAEGFEAYKRYGGQWMQTLQVKRPTVKR